MKSFCKTSMHCFKTYVKTFVLKSHEYTVHLIAALRCRPTKANKGSMLIYSDIYFNIDNVVSSRPFFSSSQTQEALGWMSEMKGALEWVSLHLWSISAWRLQQKRCAASLKTSFHHHLKFPRMDVDQSNTSCSQCFVWLLYVYDWLPSSVGALQVASWFSGLLSKHVRFLK